MNDHYFKYSKFFSEFKWFSGSEHLSTSQQEWLLHKGSLTQKLYQVATNINVEVVQEKWNTKKSENLTEDYWLREVFLKNGETPWIFAQTKVPRSSIENIATKLLNIGNKPIGLWLFSQKPERKKLEWAQAKNGLFARRGVYEIKGYPIEIKEIFLESFPFFVDK